MNGAVTKRAGNLHLVPIDQREARDFIALWHSRLPRPPATWKYQVGVARDSTLVGVVIVGRPVNATHASDPATVELHRCCVADDERNAASMLNGAAWRAAKALGYRRLITYTEADESGTSLIASGYRVVAELPPRGGWDHPMRRRVPHGREHVARRLWEPVGSPMGSSDE